MSPAATAVRLYGRVRDATKADLGAAAWRLAPVRRASANDAGTAEEPVFRPAFEDASPHAFAPRLASESPAPSADAAPERRATRAIPPPPTPRPAQRLHRARPLPMQTRGHGAVAAVRAQARAGAVMSYRAFAVAAVALVAVAGILVWTRLQVVAVGYQLSTGRQVEQRLLQEQHELDLEIAALTSPRRLEQIARERLHMAPPAPGQIIVAP